MMKETVMGVRRDLLERLLCICVCALMSVNVIMSSTEEVASHTLR